VKTFPVLSEGFELETEMTLHALHKRIPMEEVEVDFREREIGNPPKLKTFRDGLRVLGTVISLYKHFRPVSFFGLVASGFLAVGLGFGIPVLYQFVESRQILAVPSAVMATGCMILSLISLSLGIILHTLVRYHRFEFEMKLLDYTQGFKSAWGPCLLHRSSLECTWGGIETTGASAHRKPEG
jgi:hypothetical protein